MLWGLKLIMLKFLMRLGLIVKLRLFRMRLMLFDLGLLGLVSSDFIVVFLVWCWMMESVIFFVLGFF